MVKENYTTQTSDRKTFRWLLLLLLAALFIAPASAQQAVLKQENGRNQINIISGINNEETYAIIPASTPENIPGNGLPVTAGDVRDLNWVLKFSAPGKVFKDVSFADENTGYIVTELGSVYKSTDGGDNWSSVLNLGFPYYWYGVHARTPDTVIISGFNNAAPYYQGVIRWSYDCGVSWGPDVYLSNPLAGVGWLERVHFFNADTGIVINSFSGGCWYTSNGGEDSADWTYIPTNSDLAWISGNIDAQPSGAIYATGIHFVNSNDYGATWTTAPSADSIFDGGIDFLDTDYSYGWTGGGQISAPVAGWIHRTTDGGQTWSSRLNTFPYPIRALQFFDETHGLACGGNLYDESGAIYSTEDGGLTWNMEVNTSAEMFSMDFRNTGADSMVVWCVGSTGSLTGFNGVLYKATTADVATATQDYLTGEGEFVLYQNSPNPFRGITTIGFILPAACSVALKVYDIMGSEVVTMNDKNETAGFHTFTFDASELPAGLYYYRLSAGNNMKTKKLLVVR